MMRINEDIIGEYGIHYYYLEFFTRILSETWYAPKKRAIFDGCNNYREDYTYKISDIMHILGLKEKQIRERFIPKDKYFSIYHDYV